MANSISFSHFGRKHMETVLSSGSIVQPVNQIELHPYLQRANGFMSWMKAQGIVVSCFKGLAPLTIARDSPPYHVFLLAVESWNRF
jgi:diketogulonate reductase-like aldo/keto reductase